MKILNIKKLKLNKSTVNALSPEEMKPIVGGFEEETYLSPCAYTPTVHCCGGKTTGLTSEGCYTRSDTCEFV